MVFEKDLLKISLKQKRLLKIYIAFIIIDIISILSINYIFSDFDVLRYAFIRGMFISVSLIVATFRYMFILWKRFKIVSPLLKVDNNEDKLRYRKINLKEYFSVIISFIEVSILFKIEAEAIEYFRKTFETAGSYNLIVVLILLGTLTYISRSRINKRYSM